MRLVVKKTAETAPSSCSDGRCCRASPQRVPLHPRIQDQLDKNLCNLSVFVKNESSLGGKGSLKEEAPLSSLSMTHDWIPARDMAYTLGERPKGRAGSVNEFENIDRNLPCRLTAGIPRDEKGGGGADGQRTGFGAGGRPASA